MYVGQLTCTVIYNVPEALCSICMLCLSEAEEVPIKGETQLRTQLLTSRLVCHLKGTYLIYTMF